MKAFAEQDPHGDNEPFLSFIARVSYESTKEYLRLLGGWEKTETRDKSGGMTSFYEVV